MAESTGVQSRPSARGLANGLVDDAQRLAHLQVDLAKQELKELAIRNGIAAGLLAAAGGLIMLGIFVMVPVLVVVWRPQHLYWAAGFAGGYVLVGLLMALVGRLLLRIQPPRRTLESLKETKEWALRQMSSNGR